MGKMVMSMRASFDNTVFSPGSDRLSLSKGNKGFGSSPASRDLVNDPSSVPDFSHIDRRTLPIRAKKEVVDGENAMRRLRKRIEGAIWTDALEGMVRIYVDARGVTISMGEVGFFDSGSDQIKPQGRALLDAIARELASLGNHMRVEGHTDNVPINNIKFPSNWELSTARATAIVSYLIAHFSVSPELLSAAGYSEYRPVASNDKAEGRARNRRVDIVVLDPSAAQAEP